jgi:uncharacterized protein
LSLGGLARRRWLAGALSCVALPCMVQPLAARAQADWRRVAVPVYTPRDVVQGYLRDHALPRVRAWQQSIEALEEALMTAPGGAAGDAARRAWRGVAIAWSALAAVATGPLITRRSARRVDFHPVRVPLIERALSQAPAGEDAMERVGSAAKGLGALEWLLWSREAPHDGPARAYALELARDLRREADAVMAEFEAVAHRDLDDESMVSWFAEIVNQWIGGLEQLRLQRLVRPVEEARARGARAPIPQRPLARIDAAERAARWQSLQAMAVLGSSDPVPVRGQALVPIETFLRGRGLNSLADRLRTSVRAAEFAMQRASVDWPGPMIRAAHAVQAVARLAEAEIAPRLEVRVGFSDADGD